MLVGVVADTHDEYDVTRRAVHEIMQRGAEALFHCGDLRSGTIVEICSALPLYFVFGNHDSDTVPELEAAASATGSICLGWGGEVTLCGKRVGVTHGHMTVDVRPLLDAAVDYLLTGHTHEKNDSWEGVTRRICPGALFRTETPSFALVNLADGELNFVEL